MILAADGAEFEMETPSEQAKMPDLSALDFRLGQAAVAIDSSLGKDSPLSRRMSGLRERLENNRLQIAVLGQFKRGKSTFINALLGAPLLPSAVVPLTAIPTFLAWGKDPTVLVRFANGGVPQRFEAAGPDDVREILRRFVTEEANPENRLNVERVDLFFPAMMLRDGSVIIDTPGIGSTLAHNTEAALRVLPECDASFFVVSADPPITEAEVAYLKQMRAKVGCIFFVINKIDYLDADDLRRVSDFLRNVLERESLIEPGMPIFAVSGKLGLSAKQGANKVALDESGIPEVESHLRRYLATEKIPALVDAIGRKAAELLSQARSEVALRRRVIQMPLDNLAEKSAEFSRSLGFIVSERRRIDDLLSGDRRRLVDDLEARTRDLRRDALKKLTRIIEEGTFQYDRASEERMNSLISADIEEFFTSASANFVDRYSAQAHQIFRAHYQQVGRLVDGVRRTAAEMFDVRFAPEGEEEVFRLTQEPYWVTERIASRLIPDVGGLIDPFLPGAMRRRRRHVRIINQTNELIVRNTESLRWAILRSVDEAFRRAAAQFAERLDDAIGATNGVIHNALAQRTDRSSASGGALEELARAEAALASAQDAIAAAKSLH